MKLFHTTIFALLFWAVLAPFCSSRFGKMPGDSAYQAEAQAEAAAAREAILGAKLVSRPAEKAALPPKPVATPEMASGIDYSQELGLPVEWEEYTLTGEEAAKRIRKLRK
jgi:hypothetical protein